jgi:hypothetical protein
MHKEQSQVPQQLEQAAAALLSNLQQRQLEPMQHLQLMLPAPPQQQQQQELLMLSQLVHHQLMKQAVLLPQQPVP